MRALVITVVASMLWTVSAHAEPVSICAENRTEFAADMRVRALTADGEFATQIFQFRVEPGTVDCREWRAPDSEFGVTTLLVNAPSGNRSLRSGERACFQDSAESALDRLLWILVFDHRSHGYDLGCANTYRVDEVTGVE